MTLKVDYRTHSHAYGLMAIVYKALEMGGILVCCEHGVVKSSGTRGDFWVPGNKYKAIAGANAEAAISDQLEAESMSNDGGAMVAGAMAMFAGPAGCWAAGFAMICAAAAAAAGSIFYFA